MNTRTQVPYRTSDRIHHLRFRAPALPGQRNTSGEAVIDSPEPVVATDLRARLAQRRSTVRELAEVMREHSLVAELVAGSQAA